MQKYIEVLEDNYINTYEIYYKEDNKLNYYEKYLKEKYQTYHKHYGETDTASYDEFKKNLLTHDGIDEVCDMQIGDKKNIEYEFSGAKICTFCYDYQVSYIKYPMLYHVLFLNNNDMLHDLYYYIVNDNTLGVKNDDEYELLNIIDCDYQSFYDPHIPLDEKKSIIKDILDSIVFRKVSSRLPSSIDEYNTLEKTMQNIKELIYIVNKKDKVNKLELRRK